MNLDSIESHLLQDFQVGGGFIQDQLLSMFVTCHLYLDKGVVGGRAGRVGRAAALPNILRDDIVTVTSQALCRHRHYSRPH